MRERAARTGGRPAEDADSRAGLSAAGSGTARIARPPRASTPAPPAHAALAELAERHGLAADQAARLGAVLDVVEHDPRAPTTVRNPEDAVRVHLADSLTALTLPELRRAHTITDLGSGAGFPGVPLAIAMPAAHVNLLEATSRKCAFLRTLLATAEVHNASVVCERAESWRAGRASQDAVLARAVGPASVVLELAAPLLGVGGTVIDWRGRRDEAEERHAAAIARALGLQPDRIVPAPADSALIHHHLHVYLKVRPTPDRFPRRPGMARKRPLHG